MFSLFVFFGFNTYRAFGWGNRHAFPPYAAGPQPNRRLVTRNAITSRIHSVPNTPTSRNSHSPIQRRLGIPYTFLIFVSFFCPHRFLLLLPSFSYLIRGWFSTCRWGFESQHLHYSFFAT
ncbi:hypothetical protein ES288_D12G194400v1 [Gossypium darwinii]|uniref:Uncharacterized protein n=1 Tax=Gossypium darwinii TaxID=34276 RepID=A0A5D2A9V0_GOSDA|nr:hypothetical protein ES288_D12G194400v1 [Gossypium darwinii]